MRRATLGLLLLAHLFLQVQVAIACTVGSLPGVPCELPGAVSAAEHAQPDTTDADDCCQTTFQPASALYDVATPPSGDAPMLAGHAPMPMLVAVVDLNFAAPAPRIALPNEAAPPGVLGTDLYLTTLRLRI